jgi:hypothetical protein
MPDLSTNIASEAAKAASTAVDGVSVSRRALGDIIEADKYLASKAASRSMAATVRGMFSRVVPPGGH